VTKMKNSDSEFSPPNPTSGDTAHQVFKALLSPVAGAGELFERFIPSPLEKRRHKWMEIVGEVLHLLQQNLGFELENLQSNEKFVTIVFQATRIATQNHQKEKLVALRNAIVSSVLNQEISDDLQLVYIRFVDELTPTHLVLLKLLIKFESKIKKLKSYPAIFDFIHSRYEQKKVFSRDEFKMLLGDLSVRGLVRISQDIDDFEDIYAASLILAEATNDTLPRILITDVAKDFIKFISETDLSVTK
jgi:hypothetical protein